MRKLLLGLLGAAGLVFAQRQREAKKDAAIWAQATKGSGAR